MKRRMFLGTAAGFVLVGAADALASGKASTTMDPQKLHLKFSDQIEAADFEAQTGSKLTFTGNPLFADRVASGKLPQAANRLPEEPLVVLPLKTIGSYGGTLRGVSGALQSGTSEILSWRQVNLVNRNPSDNSILPNVAKSWRWNGDKSEITFTLRKGHKWSDGVEFTSDDVVFWVNDIMRNTALTPSVWGNWAHGGETVKIKKINAQTFTFIFAKPNPVFLYYLATSGSYFTPWAAAHVLKKYHIAYNPNAAALAKVAGYNDWIEQFKAYYNKWKDAVTSTAKGLEVPTLESHILAVETNGQTRKFIANPYYFKVDSTGKQLPYIDHHDERFLQKQIWTLEIISGHVDQKSQNVELSDYPLFKTNEVRGNYTVRLDSGQIGPVLIFNQTILDKVKRPIYSDKRFRYAMSVAINRPQLIEELYLGLAKGDQAMPADTPFATDADRRFMTQYDPKYANKLLDDIGMTKRDSNGFRMTPDGKKFRIFWQYTLQFTRSPEFPLLIADYWRAVGVNVLLKEVPTELLRQTEALNKLDISMEWDLPFVWNLLAAPAVYSAPWGTSTALTGAPWVTYWKTNGAEGEKPPAWVDDLRKTALAFSTSKEGSAEFMKLGARMIKLNLDNMVIIGTAGSVPQVNVVSNKLGDVPPWKLDAYRAGYAYPQRVEQWSLK